MSSDTTVTVRAITCPKCEDTIFSRAHHDMHFCSCGGIGIDGGFSYIKIAWNPSITGNDVLPEAFGLRVWATREELYQDWNRRLDKWGTLSKDCVLVKEPLPSDSYARVAE